MTMADEGVIYQEIWEIVERWSNTNDNQLNHQAIKIMALLGPLNFPYNESWKRIKVICEKYMKNEIQIIHQDTEYYISKAFLEYYYWVSEEEKEWARKAVDILLNDDERDLKEKFYLAIHQ